MIDFLKDLNEEQRKAVKYFDSPLLVLAGAGSGKTRVITYKIAYATKYLGFEPSRILAITFTNKAAQELKERISNLLGKETPIWASTFHSFCVKILRRHIPILGYSKYFEIYDENDSKRLIEKVLKDLNLDKEKYPSSYLKNIFSKVKNESLSYEELEDNLKEAYNLYNKLLKEKNALDFDDLLLKTLKLFEKDKEILNYYKNFFQYVLVDEYQDTNPTQYKLIKYLCLEKGNICCVGDDYQAIYSFRGADINIILSFEKDFKNAKIIKLTKNYRSTKTILEAANHLISFNKNNYKKHLEATKEKGEKIRLFRAPDSSFECAYLVKAINYLIKKGIRPKDIAILYRSNFLSREIEESLIKANIPYKIFGGLKFYERKEIKDILAYIKFPFFPKNEDTIERVFKYPPKGLGNVAISSFLKVLEKKEKIFKDPTLAFLETLKDLSIRKKGYALLYKLYKRVLSEFETKSYKDLINFILEEIKYLEYLEKNFPTNYEERYENVLELINALESFSKKPENKQKSKKEIFLEFISNVSLEADKDNESDAVSLMTVHAAKGLEFKVVFITSLEDGIFPARKSLEEGNVEEERRLFYVAITRAKDLLFLSYSKNRLYFGKLQKQEPSRFLSEIPKNLIYEIKIQEKSESKRQIKNYEKIHITSSQDFKTGDLVFHNKFGIGKILKVFGDNLKIFFLKLKETKEIKKDFVRKI